MKTARRSGAHSHARVLLMLLAACLRPSEDHEQLDGIVGRSAIEGLQLESEGKVAILNLSPESAELWAAAPRLRLRFEGLDQPLRLRVQNVLPDAELRAGELILPREEGARVTEGFWQIGPAENGQTLVLESADADEPRPYAIGVLSDVQEDVRRVDDIFARMNQDDLRFVVSTGDLTNNGTAGELERFREALTALEVPFYTTAGNHEVPGAQEWHELMGPFSVFFEQHGVAYSLVDSSNATVDPSLRERFLPFLRANRDRAHLFLTHVPLLDPSGLRAGAFRSRNEAARLLQDLASNNVDALFFGHVHSYYAFDLAGVPAFISGGGGAIPERLDGIDRHYLRVALLPTSTEVVESVAFVRVD